MTPAHTEGRPHRGTAGHSGTHIVCGSHNPSDRPSRLHAHPRTGRRRRARARGRIRHAGEPYGDGGERVGGEGPPSTTPPSRGRGGARLAPILRQMRQRATTIPPCHAARARRVGPQQGLEASPRRGPAAGAGSGSAAGCPSTKPTRHRRKNPSPTPAAPLSGKRALLSAAARPHLPTRAGLGARFQRARRRATSTVGHCAHGHGARGLRRRGC